MSREINASTALLKPSSPSQTKKIEIPKTQTPHAPPPIQKEILKKIEKISDDQEKAELYRKIRAYQKNEKLKRFLGDFQEPPKKTDPLDALRNQYTEMTSALKESSKRIMVMNTFDSLLQFGEIGAVQWLQRPEKAGVAAFLSSRKEELFQPELEEIIIELSDDWVPSAKTRLVLKLMQTLMAYDKNLLIPPPQDAAGEKKDVPKKVPAGKNQAAPR